MLSDRYQTIRQSNLSYKTRKIKTLLHWILCRHISKGIAEITITLN